MQSLSETARNLEVYARKSKLLQGQTHLPLLVVQREGGTVELHSQRRTDLTDLIVAGDSEDTCDLCGSHSDVAQVTCLMEGPTAAEGGYANIVFICSRCAAHIIQVTTGFRAVKTLDSWYYVRQVHANERQQKLALTEGKEPPAA